MWDKKRNMHVELNICRYVIFRETFSEGIFTYIGVVWMKCCRCWSVWRWMVSNGHLAWYRLIFYCVRSTPFTVTVRCVRSKVSVCPHVSDDVVMHVIFKEDVFEFICCGRTKNRIVFCESLQDWFKFIAVFKPWVPCVNLTKKVRWGGI